MAIIGYIPPTAEPTPAVNAQPVPDNAPPAEAAVELPFPEVTDTAAEESPPSARRGRRPRSKPMTSYEFYVCKYGGKAVQPDEWQTAYADADALIRRYERLYRVEYPTDSARDTAVCAIADAQRRFADVQSGAAAAPASVTIGSVSESYAANTAAAIDATPKAQAAEYYRILCLYADVYRGCS